MRIGTKYEIDVLRTDGIEHLFYEYLSILSAYNKMDAWSRMAYGLRVNFDVANLAREQNLLSQAVLLVVLYVLCENHDTETLVEGILKEDSTTAVISSVDIATCLLARKFLVNVPEKPSVA